MSAGGTWLVERAFHDWPFEASSGHETEADARETVRQCGPRWRQLGYRVRVRFEAGDDA